LAPPLQRWKKSFSKCKKDNKEKKIEKRKKVKKEDNNKRKARHQVISIKYQVSIIKKWNQQVLTQQVLTQQVLTHQ
jgi:hypothetical protein